MGASLLAVAKSIYLAKKQLCLCSTLFCTFLCRCFARLQRETSRKVLVSYTFFERNVVRVLLHFCRSFSPSIGGRHHFSFCHRRSKMFVLFLQQKNVFFVFFISCSRSLSPSFSLSFPGLPPTFSFSLSFSCRIFQICGLDN